MNGAVRNLRSPWGAMPTPVTAQPSASVPTSAAARSGWPLMPQLGQALERGRPMLPPQDPPSELESDGCTEIDLSLTNRFEWQTTNLRAIGEIAIKKLQLLTLWSTSRRIHCNKEETAAKQQKLKNRRLLAETQRALKMSYKEFDSQTRAREMH